MLPSAVYGKNLATCSFTAFFSCISNNFFFNSAVGFCVCVCFSSTNERNFFLIYYINKMVMLWKRPN